VLPAASVAVQSTSVSPIGKIEPDGGIVLTEPGAIVRGRHVEVHHPRHASDVRREHKIGRATEDRRESVTVTVKLP
jgi:hypothetical protein